MTLITNRVWTRQQKGDANWVIIDAQIFVLILSEIHNPPINTHQTDVNVFVTVLQKLLSIYLAQLFKLQMIFLKTNIVAIQMQLNIQNFFYAFYNPQYNGLARQSA